MRLEVSHHIISPISPILPQTSSSVVQECSSKAKKMSYTLVPLVMGHIVSLTEKSEPLCSCEWRLVLNYFIDVIKLE